MAIGRCSGPVWGSLTNPSPARRASAASRSRAGSGSSASARAWFATPRPTSPCRTIAVGEHLRRAQRRVAGVVHEHRHPAAGLGGQGAHPSYVLALVGLGQLDPRDPADDVSTEGDRLADQLLGARLPQQAVLRERHDLQVDHPPQLVTDLQQRPDTDQAARRVDVGERQHVPDAVPHPLQGGRPRAGRDPRLGVLRLDAGGQLDPGHGGAHRSRPVRRERRLADPVERVHLVQVQVGVDERLGDERPARVHDPAAVERRGRDRRDRGVADADRPPALPPAEHRVAHDQRVASRPRQSCSPMSSFHSAGLAATKSVIIATHSGSSSTTTSTPCSRSRSSAPRNVRFSPITTRGIL